MAEGQLTRRALLGAGAGLLAAGSLRPARTLAALVGAGSAVLTVQELGTHAPGTSRIALRTNADLIAVGWGGAGGACSSSPLIRVPSRGRRMGDWVRACDCAAAPGRPGERTPPHIGEPIWTGGSRELELRSARALSGVRLYLVDTSGGLGEHAVAPLRQASGASGATALALAAPVLQAGPGQPPIIARRVWAGDSSHPSVAPEYGAVRMGFVHHTENPNGYGPAEVPAMLRAIYVFHRFARGWDDIGYNFVIDLYGRIFEARAGGIDEPVAGAQAGGYNGVSTGVAVLGTFSSTPISAPARRALEHLLAWKLALHGAPAQGRVVVRVNPAGAVYSRYPANARVALPRIAGHRDADTTECPGDVLYGELPGMRPRIASLQGRPLRATIALRSASGGPAPAPLPAGLPVLVSGTLASLDGTPIAGAAVALRERHVARHGEVVS
ncbi:MAG: N-acetylmuramoyl-L-alanine amidase, partial [Acidobacteriota bacterium]|nr:N-acetylmuramoyl-L-alanine amidase [Acidobacteriota bacterium]